MRRNSSMRPGASSWQEAISRAGIIAGPRTPTCPDSGRVSRRGTTVLAGVEMGVGWRCLPAPVTARSATGAGTSLLFSDSKRSAHARRSAFCSSQPCSGRARRWGGETERLSVEGRSRRRVTPARCASGSGPSWPTGAGRAHDAAGRRAPLQSLAGGGTDSIERRSRAEPSSSSVAGRADSACVRRGWVPRKAASNTERQSLGSGG